MPPAAGDGDVVGPQPGAVGRVVGRRCARCRRPRTPRRWPSSPGPTRGPRRRPASARRPWRRRAPPGRRRWLAPLEATYTVSSATAADAMHAALEPALGELGLPQDLAGVAVERLVDRRPCRRRPTASTSPTREQVGRGADVGVEPGGVADRPRVALGELGDPQLLAGGQVEGDERRRCGAAPAARRSGRCRRRGRPAPRRPPGDDQIDTPAASVASPSVSQNRHPSSPVAASRATTWPRNVGGSPGAISSKLATPVTTRSSTTHRRAEDHGLGVVADRRLPAPLARWPGRGPRPGRRRCRRRRGRRRAADRAADVVVADLRWPTAPRRWRRRAPGRCRSSRRCRRRRRPRAACR